MPHITDSPGDFLSMDRDAALRSASRTEGTHAIADQMANVERIQAANLNAILSSTASSAAAAMRTVVLSNTQHLIGQLAPAGYGSGNAPTGLAYVTIGSLQSYGSNQPTAPAIAYANHPVGLGFYHSKIVLTPTDQARYTGDPRFQNFDRNGFRYATIGAGPDKGLSNGLWGGINRERDVTRPNNNLQGLAIPDSYKNEDAAIAALFNLVDNYNQHPVRDYDLFPAGYGDAYNSNGFISGILNAGGFAPPIHPGADVPGYVKPVPKIYFRPRPRRRSKTTRASSKSHQKRNADIKFSEAFA
jgi:hypothetical protein